ncbi:VOC family protein [Jiella sp. M17.18]|uniref:VOC family protein n=1 Tax=Jiella sp. M17.18 TaxID=3234247 RepID=UPI0034DF4F39
MSDRAGAVSSARALDHVVMPFASPAHARTTFAALGFTVAPDAVHPFGTGNACVFLADGIYLEPLVVADPVAYRRAEADGNLFVMRDAAFRQAHALPAISALALKSADADADRALLAAGGLAEEPFVEFSRDFTTASGEAATLSFRLAFACTDSDRDLTLFLCEPRHEAAPDRSALMRHENGVSGLARIVVAEGARSAVEAVLQRLNAAASATDSQEASAEAGRAQSLANVALQFAGRDDLSAVYGGAPQDGAEGVRGALGLVFAVADLTKRRQCLNRGAVSYHEVAGRLVVPLGTAGTFIAFERAST